MSNAHQCQRFRCRMMTVLTQLHVAAILLWFTAFGFGIFCLPAIGNLLTGRDIPYIMGFPAYGKGPFERVGIPTTVPLLAAFLLICTLEGLAGWLLWDGRQAGSILALVLVPAGVIFWWGFALPIPPILALIRTVLIVLSWHSFR